MDTVVLEVDQIARFIYLLEVDSATKSIYFLAYISSVHCTSECQSFINIQSHFNTLTLLCLILFIITIELKPLYVTGLSVRRRDLGTSGAG